MTVFELLLYFFITGVAMILTHEWGHIRTLEAYGKKPKVHWEKGCLVCGTNATYKGLTNKQLYRVYSNGVYAGFLPIIFSCVLFSPIYVCMIIPYLACARSDIKNMRLTR